LILPEVKGEDTFLLRQGRKKIEEIHRTTAGVAGWYSIGKESS